MKKWLTHLDMTLTIISGLLMILGFILSFNGADGTLWFIFSFLVGGFFSAKEGAEELIYEKHLNVDVLMILAAIGACLIGNWAEGALLIFIFSLAESLETMAMQKSKNAIESLLSLTPNTARRLNGTTIEEVPCDDLMIGDIIQVPKGQIVPIDGELVSPYALLNQSSITGESIPVEKNVDDVVYGGTLNESDAFNMRVTVTNDNTLFSRIIKLVEQAQSTPSKTASLIERIEDTYVKAVLIAVPLFMIVMHLVFQLSLHDAFYRGMVLLTVASPCALVASATPATLSAISRATKNNILFKGGVALDHTSRIRAIVFDKTGTLTTGHMRVATTHYFADEDFVNGMVLLAEQQSTHPIAKAIQAHLKDTPLLNVSSINEITGNGFEVATDDNVYRIGKVGFAHCDENAKTMVNQLQSTGATVILMSSPTQTLGAFAIEDTIKPHTNSVIDTLKALNVTPIMMTGDQEKSARYVAEQLGIERVYANCLPEDKNGLIKTLQNEFEQVAMVGDGVNDAPALAQANVSFAMGSGSDIAMETADVVLIRDDLSQIPFSIGLSIALKRIITQNIIFSLGMIALLIITNILQIINLPIGVIGHEGSTILVILNGLRLLFYQTKS
ncbi:heavy metal translocating P-type ATPase [Carnobacteriaceae bacterium zg-C25]|nr:heavy metal translocating P-type ATPase [Carnobacteriaceae bacterium zg-C25]